MSSKKNIGKRVTKKPPKTREVRESSPSSTVLTENLALSETTVAVLTKGESLSPYDIFKRCIKRADNLLSFHKDGSAPENDENFCDAYRAAIVLSISALDAFVRSLVIEKIKETLSNKSIQVPQKLSDYIKNLLNQDRLLEAARNYNLHEIVEKHIKEDFSTKSFQGEWKITVYMEIAGYKDIFQQVSADADINKEKLIGKLKQFTDRRHIIAHSGDYDLNQTPHSENSIDKKYAKECIDLVSKFAKHINEICQKK